MSKKEEKFEIGKTYVCDYRKYVVVKRTEKTVTFDIYQKVYNGELDPYANPDWVKVDTKRVRVMTCGTIECSVTDSCINASCLEQTEDEPVENKVDVDKIMTAVYEAAYNNITIRNSSMRGDKVVEFRVGSDNFTAEVVGDKLIVKSVLGYYNEYYVGEGNCFDADYNISSMLYWYIAFLQKKLN